MSVKGEANLKGAFHPYRLFALCACLLGCFVLVLSYVAIAIHTGNLWPWFEVVHETGDRSLIGTILYFDHAARELPLDLILGVAVGGAALFVFPGSKVSYPKSTSWLIAGGLVAVSATIIAGTLSRGGLQMLFDNLLQFPTRPGEPLEWGGHWRYHFLSHVSLLFLSAGIAGLLLLFGEPTLSQRTGFTIFTGVCVLFAVLSVIFGFNWNQFTDPVPVGHQLRESFTHTLVTVPLAWGICAFMGRGQWTSRRRGRVVWLPFVLGSLGVLAGLFLTVSSFARSAASQGQTDSLVLLVFPHFFEHSFSYVVAILSASFVFLAGQARDGR